MSENKNLPVYPHLTAENFNNGVGSYTTRSKPGISQRTLIAAMCLQGLMSNPETINNPEDAAKYAVQHADALLNHLEKTK